jgi:hypothetical protein
VAVLGFAVDDQGVVVTVDEEVDGDVGPGVADGLLDAVALVGVRVERGDRGVDQGDAGNSSRGRSSLGALSTSSSKSSTDICGRSSVSGVMASPPFSHRAPL